MASRRKGSKPIRKLESDDKEKLQNINISSLVDNNFNKPSTNEESLDIEMDSNHNLASFVKVESDLNKQSPNKTEIKLSTSSSENFIQCTTSETLSNTKPINEIINGKRNDGLNNAVFEKFTRFKKLMTLMASKPANEAMLESGVTMQEFLYFQNMLNKNPAINCNLNLPEQSRTLPLVNNLRSEQTTTCTEKQQPTYKVGYINQTTPNEFDTHLYSQNNKLKFPVNRLINPQHHRNSTAAAAFMLALSKMNGNGIGSQNIRFNHLINNDLSNPHIRSLNYNPSFNQLHQQQQDDQNTKQGLDYQQEAENEVDSITAGTVSSGVGSIKRGTLPPTSFHAEIYDKYIQKFSASNPCNQQLCPHRNREHYHCIDSDCNYQRFTNKSDVKRHYNMHKKRDNSLLHGFMRFAPNDDCRHHFKGPCIYNGKSTHYHCLHSGCTKVYTSTSDVMTHKKFHVKDEELAKNGFQRYRANERCNYKDCPFNDMKTTHFHCTRDGCNFRFKNKSEMEKHKSYHIKDDNYTRQGFKKFYKNEDCRYVNCQWNGRTNHFHCLRPNCNESFSSTNQAISHKRKHERELEINQSAVANKSDQPSKPAVSELQKLKLPKYVEQASRGDVKRRLVKLSFNKTKKFPLSSCFLANFSRENHNILKLKSQAHLQNQNLYPKKVKLNFHPFNHEQIKSMKSLSASSASELRQSGSFMDPVSMNENLNKKFHVYNQNPNKLIQKHLEKSSKTATNGDLKDSSSTYCVNRFLPLSNFNGTGSTNGVGNSDNTPINLSLQKEEKLTLRKNLYIKDIKSKTGLELLPSNEIFKNSYFAPSSVTQGISRYFRGYEPGECSSEFCSFVKMRHYHCTVEGCCAVFTDIRLVVNHASYHEQLRLKGVVQIKLPTIGENASNASNTSKSNPSLSPYSNYSHSLESNLSSEKSSKNLEERLTIDDVNLKSNANKNTSTQMEVTSNKKLHENQLNKNVKNESTNDGIYMETNSVVEYEKESEDAMYSNIQDLTKANNSQNSSTNSAILSNNHRKRTYDVISMNKSLNGSFISKPDFSFQNFKIQKQDIQNGFDGLKKSITSDGISYEQNLDENFKNITTASFNYNSNNGHHYKNNSTNSSTLFTHHGNMNEDEDENFPVDLSKTALSLDNNEMNRKTSNNTVQLQNSVCLNSSSQEEDDFFSSSKYKNTSKNDRTEVTNEGHMFTSYKLNSKTKLPEGFEKFDHCQDCHDVDCQFRNKAPHYHCTHERCGYKFLGRSHINKHRLHHQRVAMLEKNDFKRYKVSQNCQYKECLFKLKNTHFHCLRCSFTCTDSAKVQTHRKSHDRQTELQQFNFERFRGSDDCGRNDCKHRKKQISHYHCTDCDYTVVGMSSIASHYQKHNEKMLQNSTSFNDDNTISLSPSTTVSSNGDLHLKPSSTDITNNFIYPRQMVSNAAPAIPSYETVGSSGFVSSLIPVVVHHVTPASDLCTIKNTNDQ